MNIAFVTPEFPNPKTGVAGGIGTSILNLSKGLSLLGNNVLIFVYGQNKDEVVSCEHYTIYKIKNRKFGSLTRFLTQKKVQSVLNILIAQDKVDIVEFPDWTGFSSNINLKCPNVIRLNGSDTYFCHLDNRKVKIKNYIEEKNALTKATGLLSVSAYTAILTKKLFTIDRNFEVIPNCIDLTKFINNNDIKVNENTLLYFGTLIRKKGLLELPLIFNEVYKKNPNVKLVLIGRDASDATSGAKSTWSIMKTLFDVNAINNVNYMGSVGYDEIKEHICKATLCIFPTFAEALPVSWIEAMALEKAIVASNIGWAKEVIDDGENGYLVDPINHILFAAKIIELIENETLRLSFGLKAKEKASKNFSIEVVAKKNLEYYKKLIKNLHD